MRAVVIFVSSIALLMIACGGVTASDLAVRAIEADSLYRRALELPADANLDQRRQAMRDLDEASRLDPKRADVWRALARLCLSAGELDRSRRCLARLEETAPEDAEARLELGRIWRWDWLSSLEPDSYAHARGSFIAAARLAPRLLEPRLALTALGLATGDRDLARRAAESALRADADAPEALLAIACVAYRDAALARADSAFHLAISRLPSALASHFEDFSSIDADVEREDAHLPFWKDRDPDLTTPENEIELDFLSRVAQALLLFRDERDRPHWDMRSELFARYGLPSRVRMNPPGERAGWNDGDGSFQFRRLAPVYYAPDPLPYPYDRQVWSYPQLGMEVALWDMSLRGKYDLPVAYGHDPDPRPRIVAGSDVVVVGNGRGVYRTLPPGVESRPARGEIARFPDARGAVLFGGIETLAGPSDTLAGAWVIADDGGRAVTRGTSAFVVSACDPARRRVATFTADVPPGRYRVDLSVVDARGRRGVAHGAVEVPPPAGSIALSDLVLVCDARTPSVVDPPRIEPNLERRVGHARPLLLYFEVSGLTLDASRAGRFRYHYVVRPITKKRGEERIEGAVFEATREEQSVGSTRRQFLNIPLAASLLGENEIEVEITDVSSGATAHARTRFVRE
jgi:tetratricopeptide (TPR) repeat protein